MNLLIVLRCSENAAPKETAAAWYRIAAACAAAGLPCDTLLYGTGRLAALAEAAGLTGRVLLQPAPRLALPDAAAMLGRLIGREGYRGVILGDSPEAAGLAVLLGERCGFRCLNGVTAFSGTPEALCCCKPVYANNLIGRYVLAAPFVFSEKLPAAGRPAAPGRPRLVPLPFYAAAAALPLSECAQDAGQEWSSPVLIAAGMGIAERQDIEKLRAFCRENGFSFGVTRPVAMRGWAPTAEILGVSGAILAPKVTVTLGVSGSAAFYAGIEQSEYILSVNPDPGAGIAHLSDAVLAEDYRQVLPPLLARLAEYRRPPQPG